MFPRALIKRSLGNWLAGRDAVYQLAAMTSLGARLAAARHKRALELD
jgi:hypothetical protein